MSSTIARIVTWIMSAVIGFGFGAAGSFGVSTLPTPIPTGLIVSLLGCTAILVALRLLADDRWAVLAGGIGMYAAVLVLMQRGPGGSVVLPDSILSIVWILGVAGVILLVVAWPDPARLARLRPVAPADPTTTPDGSARA